MRLRLEPEQEEQLVRELQALSPILARTLEQYREMRSQSMEYVQMHGILISALADGDNFPHIADTFEFYESKGCHHYAEQLFALIDIFFILGREIERSHTQVSPTFVIPDKETDHGTH